MPNRTGTGHQELCAFVIHLRGTTKPPKHFHQISNFICQKVYLIWVVHSLEHALSLSLSLSLILSATKNFFYFPEYFLLSELPDGKLLEGFLSHRKVNYLSLAFCIDQNNEFSATNKFSLTVTVTQSSIHALTHPSDVPRLVPSSVRRVLNHFMKPVDDVAGISYDSDGENEDGQGLQF